MSFTYFSLWYGSWSNGSSGDPPDFGIWTCFDQRMWQFSTRRTASNKATHRWGTRGCGCSELSITIYIISIIFCSIQLVYKNEYYWLGDYGRKVEPVTYLYDFYLFIYCMGILNNQGTSDQIIDSKFYLFSVISLV